jgi:hypothetical protein
LLAGQIKAAAFVDELTKLAIPSMGQHEIGAAMSGLVGAAGLYEHGPWGEGGRSKGEAKAYQAVQRLEDQDQKDPQVQEELRRALTDQRKAARGAEGAGGWLGATGFGGASLYARHKLFRVPGNMAERGAVTTPAELRALYADLTKQLGHGIPGTPLPEGGSADGLSIPKGGFYPKFLRNLEAKKYEPLFLKDRLESFKQEIDQFRQADPEQYKIWLSEGRPISKDAYEATKAIEEEAKKDARQALETGFVRAPMKAGPHVSAHEFGHAMFGNSTLGKLTHMVRMPAAYAGGFAALTAATATDPDSTASKLSPLMAAAGVAPYLGEEAMASINAIKSMKRTGFSPQQLSVAKKQFGRAFGTYGLGLGLPVIAAPYIIRKVKQYNQSRREKQGLESPGQLQQRINSLPQATGD